MRHAHFCFRRSKGEKDSKQKNKGKEGKSNQNLCFRICSCYFCLTHFCTFRIRVQLRGRAALWWSSSSGAGLAELELCQTCPKSGICYSLLLLFMPSLKSEVKAGSRLARSHGFFPCTISKRDDDGCSGTGSCSCSPCWSHAPRPRNGDTKAPSSISARKGLKLGEPTRSRDAGVRP